MKRSCHTYRLPVRNVQFPTALTASLPDVKDMGLKFVLLQRNRLQSTDVVQIRTMILARAKELGIVFDAQSNSQWAKLLVSSSRAIAKPLRKQIDISLIEKLDEVFCSYAD